MNKQTTKGKFMFNLKAIKTKLSTTVFMMLLALLLANGVVQAQPTITTFAPDPASYWGFRDRVKHAIYL